MATIAEIIKEFCYRINEPAPSAIVGVDSPSEKQYLSIFKFIGDNLRNRPYQWPQLKQGYTFTTETGERRYQLPGDFYRLLNSAQWDVTNKWPLRGPVSDFNFSLRQYSVVSLQTRKAYRVIGPTNYLYSTAPYQKRSASTIEIDPAGVNNTDQLFLGYLSGNWIWPRDWVTATAYTAGDIRTGDGYVYRASTSGTSGATRPNWSTGSGSDGTVTWEVYREPYQVSASNSNLNDNDLCLFDDDLMIEGMRWAYYRAKKQEFEVERNDWEDMVKSAYARFQGPCRISMSDEGYDMDDWPVIPDGNWSV